MTREAGNRQSRARKISRPSHLEHAAPLSSHPITPLFTDHFFIAVVYDDGSFTTYGFDGTWARNLDLDVDFMKNWFRYGVVYWPGLSGADIEAAYYDRNRKDRNLLMTELDYVVGYNCHKAARQLTRDAYDQGRGDNSSF